MKIFTRVFSVVIPQTNNRLFLNVGGGLVVLGCALLPAAPLMAQDDPADACEEAARLIREDNDLEGALDEARWCVESLEQLKEKHAMSVFPDAVGEFVGGETSNQKAFGMSMIERTYTSGSSAIKLSLMGGGPAGAGLAAIAQLGSQAGTKMRIQRRTVVDMSEGNEATFMVQLRSGGVLNITSTSADKETTVQFIKDFPIAELDDALKE